MKGAFFETLLELASRDERVMLVTGDLGFGSVERFAERLPKQFLNVGVAEQNMTGIAAGLALCGRIVFTYSIATFATLRCLEQIRNDVCHHNADVKIIGVGGGFAYGALGASHHAIEDLAIMRALPGMIVVAPGDPAEASGATRAIAGHRGPAYLRLGRAGEASLHPDGILYTLGRAILMRDGTDATLIACGSILQSAVTAADRLAQNGIRCRVLSMHTISPLDVEAVRAAARETRAIVTVEEHRSTGGLGSAVAEVLAESEFAAPFRRVAIPSSLGKDVGTQQYLRDRYHLTSEAVLRTITTMLESARPVARH